MQPTVNAPLLAFNEIEIRDIPGYPHYRAGSDGSIWSNRTVGGRILSQYRRMTPVLSNRGDGDRWTVGLRKDGVYKRRSVHSLILETFSGPRPAGMHGCHGDGNRDNNSASNLRWDTCANNHADRNRHGTHFSGDKNPSAKLNSEMVAEIRRLHAGGMMQKNIAPLFGISKPTVQQIVTWSTWRDVGDAIKRVNGTRVRKPAPF